LFSFCTSLLASRGSLVNSYGFADCACKWLGDSNVIVRWLVRQRLAISFFQRADEFSFFISRPHFVFLDGINGSIQVARVRRICRPLRSQKDSACGRGKSLKISVAGGDCRSVEF
jgi:hypothetical protein